MTAQQLIELVLEASPQESAAIAKLHLQGALDYFCEKTLILRKRAQITISGSSLRQTISTPDDIIRIRQISHDGTLLAATDQPSYLADDNGFWYVETNSPLVLYIGQWSNGAETPFANGDTFDIIYEAYAQTFGEDGAGNEDLSVEPEIPKRFHEALTYRACEKANVAHPEMRSYWHALWRDELLKGRRHANEMHTNAPINPKIYTL